MWYNIRMKIKDIDKKIDQAKQDRKAKIKAEPNKFKRFWKWVWYYMTFTFVWIFQNMKDWRTMVIFLIVMAVISCEVWIPYLMGLITWGTDFSKWCFGIASTIWIWWLLPGTPFLPLCIFITIGIKALFNRIKAKRR